MKAVRLTTAFAVGFGVVLPLPAAKDLIPPSWAAEKDAPSSAGDVRKRAEDLAKSASDRFGEIVDGKNAPAADTGPSSGAAVGVAEHIHGWTARSSADYQVLMRGLSQPVQFNPVADAEARIAARRTQQSFAETVIGWVHRSAVQYQTLVRGLLSEPGQTIVAARGPEVEGKQAEDARRLSEVLKAAEATKVEEARAAAAKQGEDARRAEEARRVAEAQKSGETQKAAEAKKAEEARAAAAAMQAEDARRVAEEQKAVEVRKAEEARVAAAKQVEDARRVAEEQKAAEAKKAEEARVAAAARQADDARRVEDARRLAEVQKAAEARKAEEARAAAAKQAEDARQAEEARRVAEAQKVAEAKKAEEVRVAAAKQAEDVRRADESRRVAEAQGIAETKASERPRAATTPSRKRTAAQQRAERSERTAKRGPASRKVAVAGSRKRVGQAAPATAGKSRRKKSGEHVCRMAGNRVKLPGWYVVKRGDTLWKIAARHYGKGQRYPVIYRANVRRIADPNIIVRCQRIYLPKFRRRGS